MTTTAGTHEQEQVQQLADGDGIPGEPAPDQSATPAEGSPT